MSDIAAERYVVTDSETVNVTVSYKGKLSAGELLTGTPTVTEETTSDLTITNKAVNTAEYTFKDGTVVAIGQGVQFSFSGQQAGETYNIDTLCSTDATPAQVRNVEVVAFCKAT
jgi:formylmethanofuran dehydrogenase subunit A